MISEMLPVSIHPMRLRTVIIADDVAEIRNLVAKFLEPFGYKVTSAPSGREAAKLLRTIPCDVLVADVLMPDGDGIELISDLRRTDSPVKIVAISGGGGGLEADYCVQLAKGLGAQAVLTKPFSRKQLMAAIDGVLAN